MSELKKTSVFGGAAVLLAYAIHRGDPVFILGQSLGFFIYARNLWLIRAERRDVDEAESRAANGPDWDRYADDYQATHGEFLGDAGFVWGPEGLTEAEAGVLGDVRDKDVLEVGSGAGQCSRWVRARGGRGVGLALVERGVLDARAAGIKIIPLCPYAKAQIEKHPEWQDVLAGGLK